MDPDSRTASLCDPTDTLNFFYSRLLEQVATKEVAKDETLYVASILTNYALTSRSDPTSMPPLADLYEVFNYFVLNSETLLDLELLENAGAQSLFLVGFFRGQMRSRHNLNWFDQMGGTFYLRASQLTASHRRSQLFRKMARHFPIWSTTCWRLSEEMRESRYLIQLE